MAIKVLICVQGNSVDQHLEIGYVIFNNHVEDYLFITFVHPSFVCHESPTIIIDKIYAMDMPFIITLGSNLCRSIGQISLIFKREKVLQI